MKISDKNVVRLAVVQHIRAQYGIKIKNWNKKKTCKFPGGPSVRVFGVPLDNLAQCAVPEYGTIPCFLVDACTKLIEHVHTEGLFRKSGSVTRLKALRVKLDQGEACIPTALPCDVAGLLKQFFRELPESILPTDLQDALLKAQQLPTAEERTSALQLLSCVLPDRNAHTLRYFFTFLRDVSQRYSENKMDSGNLSVIFTPNLLHCEGAEKMSSGMERRLKLQAAVVRFFIENPQDIGVVPPFILERIPAMVGYEAGLVSPVPIQVEDWETDSGVKKKVRRSLGDVVNGALHKLKANRTPANSSLSSEDVFSVTPVIVTPNTKRKMPLEVGHSCSFSNKKRKSIKKNLGLELLPNSLFSSSSTPGSGRGLDSSPCVSLSASVGKTREPSARRKSKRMSKHVSRVESGKAGCFSPRGAKKESVRRSLRLRFSLGRSRGDPASETVGWRLATQESTTSFQFAKDTPFSPTVLHGRRPSKRSKQISKSEDNLLSPQCAVAGQRTSWNLGSPAVFHAFSCDSLSDTPVGTCNKNSSCSDPTLATAKPPAVGNLSEDVCSSFVGGDTVTGPTVLQIKKAFADSGSNLHSLIDCSTLSGKELVMQAEETSPTSTDCQESKRSCYSPTPKKAVADEQNVTISELEITPLTPLHIDSTLSELGPSESPLDKEESVFQSGEKGDIGGEVDQENNSGLVEVIDGNGPSVSCKIELQVPKLNTPGLSTLGTPPPTQLPTAKLCRLKTENSPGPKEAHHLRVADHIHRFNTLTLNSPKTKAVRSPLKFQRTPVRQSVRRINTLLISTTRVQIPESPVRKSISLESGLSVTERRVGEAHVDKQAKRRPKVAPRRPSTNRWQGGGGALDDVTNRVQPKAKSEPCQLLKNSTASRSVNPPKIILHEVYENDKCCYRGSPRNPLSEGRLLSAMKPIDL
ncbi:rho GTPase-activating protein 11A isoform X2 [Brienomyrus brachyistius]|uniref:rho GTPase-activating protein 11A isoform X2 n=1 Tax=Brienomyrus brachyistius TaxID=42636 RepID=UPI0020B396D7|nr:rho GTPase-activating protein 11A isoform X2 [Brienomyrus brachyistius]